MEDMRQEAGWQSLRQIRPVDAYKSKGYELFQNLTSTIRHDVTRTIYHVGMTRQAATRAVPSEMAKVAVASAGGGKLQPRRAGKKIGRNEPCPCGSGKKYKYCCGR